MATVPRTTKRTPSPFTLGDHIAEWWTHKTRKMQKEFRRLVNAFQVWSTVGFWAIVIYYAGAKGWIF